jgi:hypothetical protein
LPGLASNQSGLHAQATVQGHHELFAFISSFKMYFMVTLSILSIEVYAQVNSLLPSA